MIKSTWSSKNIFVQQQQQLNQNTQLVNGVCSSLSLTDIYILHLVCCPPVHTLPRPSPNLNALPHQLRDGQTRAIIIIIIIIRNDSRFMYCTVFWFIFSSRDMYMYV